MHDEVDVLLLIDGLEGAIGEHDTVARYTQVQLIHSDVGDACPVKNIIRYTSTISTSW